MRLIQPAREQSIWEQVPGISTVGIWGGTVPPKASRKQMTRKG